MLFRAARHRVDLSVEELVLRSARTFERRIVAIRVAMDASSERHRPRSLHPCHDPRCIRGCLPVPERAASIPVAARAMVPRCSDLLTLP